MPTYTLRSLFHPDMKDNTVISELDRDLNKAKARAHDAKNEFIAGSLLSLYRLIEESESLPRKTRSTEVPTPIKNIKEFFRKVQDRIESDKLIKSSKKKMPRKINTSGARGSIKGDYVQEEIAADRPFWFKDIYPHPCPLCNHCSVVPHQKNEDIVNETHCIMASYRTALAEYNLLSKSQQRLIKAPKVSTFPKQFVACMCIANKCLDFRTGKGCINCAAMVRCGLPIEYDPVTMTSSCAMCRCTCTAYFTKDKWSKLKSHHDIDAMEKSKEREKQTMKMEKAAGKVSLLTHSFICACVLSFTHIYCSENTADIRYFLPNDQCATVIPPTHVKPAAIPTKRAVASVPKDHFAAKSHELASSQKFQTDIPLRNSLKKQVTPPSSFLPSGEHIDTVRDALRANRQQKRKERTDRTEEVILQHQETIVLSSDSSTGTYTPSPPAKKTRSRLTNNGLEVDFYNQLTQHSTNGFSTPTPFLASSVSAASSFPPAAPFTPASSVSAYSAQTPAKWEQKVRIECIRKMRSTDGKKVQARKLFAIVNQKQPVQLWRDIHVMGDDCQQTGMIISEIVECMIDYIESVE